MKVNNRLKAEAYSTEIIAVFDRLSTIESCSIKGIAGEVVCGPFGSAIHETDYRSSGIPLIRVSDIKSTFVNDKGLVFIDKDLSNKLNRTIVTHGDIVVSQRGAIGSIGQFAIVTDSYDKWNISANLIAIREPKIKSEYLLAFLNSKYGQIQILGLLSGQAQPKITTVDIENILVYKPNDEFQIKISSLIQSAYAKRKEAEEKYRQAEKLLYNALGISETEFEDKLAYTGSLKEAEASGTFRLDADYYQPKYKQIVIELEQTEYSIKRVGDVCDIQMQKLKIEKKEYRQKVWKYLEIGNINSSTGEIEDWTEARGWELPAGSKLPLHSNDIVYSKVRPYLKGIALVPETLSGGIGTGGFVVLRPKDVSPEFLLLYLRSDFGNTPIQQKLKGTTYPTITEEDVADIPIPKVDKKLHDDITILIRDSFHIRKESKSLIEQAKREVEEEIERVAQERS